jgi:hypothetical protein
MSTCVLSALEQKQSLCTPGCFTGVTFMVDKTMQVIPNMWTEHSSGGGQFFIGRDDISISVHSVPRYIW